MAMKIGGKKRDRCGVSEGSGQASHVGIVDDMLQELLQLCDVRVDGHLKNIQERI